MAVPGSTYRVQVAAEFDLRAAAGLVDYLATLGVTHLYSSPLLTAVAGSAHGYDVVDPRYADPARGGESGRLQLAAALRAAGLGLVLDVVPNHAGVAAAEQNPAWWDVLRLGPQSVYARWFDIDWSRGRLLLPVLADAPGALDDLRLADGELRYFERRYPLAPGTQGIDDPRKAHDHQHYELVSWRRGSTEHNYRRFFAISDLAALRVEDEAVFDATHAELLRWVAAGDVDGLRIDHPDGLTDPAGYLARLAERAPGGWVVVEKILEPGEDLPGWPVAGTTGYDALSEVDGVLVDPDGEAPFTALDESLTGARTSWPELVHEAKLDVATGMLRAEVRRLAALAPGVPDAEAALAELLASFPVYRSYLPDGAEHLAAAVDAAARWRPDLASTVDLLAARLADPDDPLAVRFQQTSGAVMAKGVEDTAYYRWTRFVALNEVGGDPDRFGLPLAEFHDALAQRQQRHPAGMTTLSTHDTKRSADVRVAARGAGGAAGGVGRRGRPVVGAGGATGRGARAPALADGGRGMAAVGAAAARVPGQGDAGGAHPDQLERPGPGVRDRAARGRGRGPRLGAAAGRRRGLRRADHPVRLVELADRDAGAADHARGAGHLPGRRAVGPLAGGPGQPAAGRLRPAPVVAVACGRRLAATGGRLRRRQAARRHAGAAAAPGPPVRLLRLPAAARVRSRCGARGRVLPRRRRHRRHPAAGATGAGRLGRHDAPAAARPLDRRPHRPLAARRRHAPRRPARAATPSPCSPAPDPPRPRPGSRGPAGCGAMPGIRVPELRTTIADSAVAVA